MQIDWFTFAAQILNFLVLVWLLKRFLYGPILEAIAARERSINDRLQTAADREQAAEAARASYVRQQDDLTHLRESLLAEAATDADRWRKERLEELRQEVTAARRMWHQSVSRERSQFLGELRQRSAKQVQQIVRHVLQELADDDLESLVIHQFLKRLDEETNGRLKRPGDGPILVRTGFPLRPDDESALSAEMTRRTGAETIRFESDPDLICGVEVVSGDHKIHWNVDNYLQALERSITSTLNQHEIASAHD